MAFFRYLAVALLAIQARAATDPSGLEYDIKEINNEDDPQSPNLQVKISTSFPQAEIFGVKLVNGHTTEAVLSVSNDEPTPVNVLVIGGALWTTSLQQPAVIVKNLTATKYNFAIPAGESETFRYLFAQDLHPQDLRLQLWAALTDGNDNVYQMHAYNETVSVVEAPTSIFDPQIIFLYLVLAGLFAGTSYFIYTTWITTLFPQQAKRRGARPGDRVKAAPRSPRKGDEINETAGTASEGAAVTSGAQTVDMSWIPAQHLQKPEAKRIKSGTPTGVKTKSRAA